MLTMRRAVPTFACPKDWLRYAGRMKLVLALVLPALAAVVYFQMGLIVEAIVIATVMGIASVLLALTTDPNRR